MQDWDNFKQGQMMFAGVQVSDVDAMSSYYKSMFGMSGSTSSDGKPQVGFRRSSREVSSFKMILGEGGSSLDIGEDFGHFGLAVEDVYAFCDAIRRGGGKITREPGPVKGGTSVIAFVEDPSGYKWELIQRPQGVQEPFCQVMLRVGDLDKSRQWYEEVLGMRCLRTRDNPDYKYTLAFMGYGPEEETTVVELTYNYGRTQYRKGNGLQYIALRTGDMAKTAQHIKEASMKLGIDPQVKDLTVEGLTGCCCVDPDGYKYVFVEG